MEWRPAIVLKGKARRLSSLARRSLSAKTAVLPSRSGGSVPGGVAELTIGKLRVVIVPLVGLHVAKSF